MAHLEKLQIQGLRSFGPRDEDRQKMNFYSAFPTQKRDAKGKPITEVRPWPLTLILGQNGCGKTTIIECLRYVTTGDHPPGSKSGRSFIHDPKMAGEVTILANVRLSFRSANGQQCLISRNMEASQKAKTLNVRTLDNMFSKTDSQGNKVNLSTKCTDINSMILDNLGVSKPILNYVIFCHQEDSNWPLDEGSKVKSKFDEIFASDKYQNCLKNIKDTTKKHRDELRVEKKSLEFIISDKKVAAEKRRELEDKNTTANVLQDQVQAAINQLKPILNDLAAIRETEQNYTGLIQRQEKAKTLREEKEKQIREIEDTLAIDLESVTDDEVAELKNSVEVEIRQTEKKLNSVKSEALELRDKIGKEERERAIKLAEVAECTALRKTHQDNKKDVDKKALEFGKLLGWQEMHDHFSGDKTFMEDALQKLKTSVSDSEKQVKKINQEMDAQIEEKSAVINDLEKNKALIEDKKKRSQTELNECKSEIANITTQLRKAQDSLETLQDVQQTHAKKEAELAQLKSSTNLEELKSKVFIKKKELKDLEKDEARLKEEKALLDSNHKVMSDISLKEKDKEEKHTKLSALERKSAPKFQEVFGTGNVPNMSLLKDRFSRVSEQISCDKKALESDMQRMKHESESKKDKRQQLKSDIKVKEGKIEKFAEQVADVNHSDDDIDAALDAIKNDIDLAREEVAQKEAHKFTFKDYIQRIDEMQRDQLACPTCNRRFQKADEAKALKADLQLEIDKIPARVKVIKETLKKALVRQDKLQILSQEKKQIDELKTEVEERKSTIKTLDNEIKKLDSEFAFKETELGTNSSKHALCEELRDVVFLMDNLYHQVSELEEKLRELRYQNADIGNARSLEEFQKEEEVVLRKISAARKEIEAKQARELEVERKINQLERDLNTLVQEKLEIEKQQNNLANMDKTRKELQEKTDVLKQQLKEIEERLTALGEDVSAHSKERNKLFMEKDRKVDAAQKECNEIRRMEGEFQSLVDKIHDYENGGNEKKLEDRQRQLESIVHKKEKKEKDLKSLEMERSSSEESLSSKQQQLKAISDTLYLRRLKREETEYANEEAEASARLKDLNFENELRRKEELSRQYQSIDRQKSEKQGRLEEMRATIRSLERELNTDKFRDADRNFQSQCISHRCRQHVIQDLEKYYKALSYAITRFHQERMRVINRIVRELWRSTYKGNDIDYIEIKTDEVDPNAEMEKRKVCNYQVVMIKNNTEMEMRGRCSAGQKVLASLVIRLALAETFSANCGIIALDEPTTNLDRDNINSLAEALASIVEKRSTVNRNFQLIVITHDEDLINDLGRGVPEQNYYYKISRSEKGLSQIRKWNINGLGAGEIEKA